MKTTPSLTIIPIVVTDQEEALRFYIEKLGLEKRADVIFGPDMRWLTVASKGQKKPEIALAKPEASLLTVQTHSSHKAVGRPGHGITCIFDTDDCCKMHATLLARGIKFLSPPTKQVYGMEAVFEDPYGNAFSLLEPSPEAYALLKDASVSTAA